MSGRDPLLVSESVGIGKDRRKFIIISIFDASLNVLLWLLCTVTKGDDWSKVFMLEVNIFDPKFMSSSLFDIVLCACMRMVVLILCYGVFIVRHWAPVAITTTLSTIFIVIKVLFFFSHKQGGLPQYLLVVSSFSIAWFELWLMPFKVLPRERRCEHFDSFASHDDVVSVRDRRSPSDPVSVSRSRVVGVLPRNSNNRHFSDDDFRSAVEYTSASEDETRFSRFKSANTSVLSKEAYDKILHDAEIRVDILLREARLGKWKVLKSNSPMVLQGPDSSYYIYAEFKCSPLVLFNAAWKDVLKWNPQVVECRSVLNIDSTTELYYSMSAPALKGYVSSRDFLDVRRIRLDSAALIYSGIFVSVESTISPANEKVTRGHNGPSVIRVVGGDSANEACLEWIMRTDLRGGLPKRLVQCSMLSYFIEHISRLREYVERQSIAES